MSTMQSNIALSILLNKMYTTLDFLYIPNIQKKLSCGKKVSLYIFVNRCKVLVIGKSTNFGKLHHSF